MHEEKRGTVPRAFDSDAHAVLGRNFADTGAILRDQPGGNEQRDGRDNRETKTPVRRGSCFDVHRRPLRLLAVAYTDTADATTRPLSRIRAADDGKAHRQAA